MSKMAALRALIKKQVLPASLRPKCKGISADKPRGGCRRPAPCVPHLRAAFVAGRPAARYICGRKSLSWRCAGAGIARNVCAMSAADISACVASTVALYEAPEAVSCCS